MISRPVNINMEYLFLPPKVGFNALLCVIYDALSFFLMGYVSNIYELICADEHEIPGVESHSFPLWPEPHKFKY